VRNLIRMLIFSLVVLSTAYAQESDYMDMSLEELLGIRVVTASKQAEPLCETPVPVTVITSEMIKNSGALNLKSLLITYVPGITFSQDQNEVNVAMRGIYGSSQQKILIMQDGHRLNCRGYSEANPDFSISLEKIKQIEVMRGPGSSLYGNVALTAVINIITKSGDDGDDIDGEQVHVGGGNYGQRQLSVLVGKTFDHSHEILLWGSGYRSSGEVRDIPEANDYSAYPADSEAILDGFDDEPSFDLGLKYRTGNLELMGMTRNSHYIEPFSAGGTTGQSYDYNDYRTLDGVGPGLGSKFTHLGAKYHYPLGDDLELDFLTYYDMFYFDVVLIINPASKTYAGVHWNEYDLGSIVQLKKTYAFNDLGDGNIIAGFQIDHMQLIDSYFAIGVDGDWVTFNDTEENRVLGIGNERIYSGFLQLKHRFSEKLITNFGLRYDQKDRHTGDDVSALEPRLALIYLPSQKYELKISFSQSFVDAPYWYRYNGLASYRGGVDLKPEHVNSLQITPALHLLDNKLNYQFNFFYNELTDFIWRNNAATAEEPIYQNAGGMTSWGIENEVSYRHRLFNVHANLTYQQARDAENYAVTDGDIHNVPNLTANAVLAVRPFSGNMQNTWFNFTARYVGSQLSPVNITFNDVNGDLLQRFNEPEREVDAVLLFNVGVRIKDVLRSGLSVEATVFNLLETGYEQGGSVSHPYPQPSRWFFASVSYLFTN